MAKPRILNVADDAAWVAVPFEGDEDWVAVGACTADTSGLHLTELRIIRAHKLGRTRGTFDAADLAKWPEHDLPTRLLRQVPKTLLLRTAREAIQAVSPAPPGGAEGVLPEPPGPRRPRRAEYWIAYIAWVYDTELRRGEPHPIKRIAEEYEWPPTMVRDYVREARRRKYLSKAPGRGKPGGRLTPAGRARARVLTFPAEEG